MLTGAAGRRLPSLPPITDRLERLALLDSPVRKVRQAATAVLRRPGPLPLVSGRELGHPVHPVLVDLPIGLWASALVLDLLGPHYRDAARRLAGLGVLVALPAAVTGASDWIDTDGAEARVGLVHAAVNDAALLCFATFWRKRRGGGRAGRSWGLLGGGLLAAGGWLGGHLAYGMGVGVDTNAFESGPEEWEAVGGGVPAPGEMTKVVADGVRIVVADTSEGLRGLADRCSHRGGPLSDGERMGNCVVCPWHGSRFDLDSGAVLRGPASVPPPTYEVRSGDSGLEVRRSEERALRRRVVRD